jgi:hypothetical protein
LLALFVGKVGTDWIAALSYVNLLNLVSLLLQVEVVVIAMMMMKK